MQSYFKTNDPSVLAAMAAYEAEAKLISKAGVAFADRFGGHILTRRDIHGFSVVGIYFKPAKDDQLWTKPDPMYAGMQRPRTTLRKATKDQRAALKALLIEYDEHFPRQKADFDPVLEAMGTDWGALFLCGFSMFGHEGSIYAATSATLGPAMQEILASEFHTAKAEAESIKEAA